MLRNYLKKIAAVSPIPLTRNEYYDRLTKKVIQRACSPDSVCVDVGANNGKILQMFVLRCHQATHFAFEPIPYLYKNLQQEFGDRAIIYNIALSNRTGKTSFNYVISDPAYSGLKKRQYDGNLKDTIIEVEVSLLDNIIENDTNIALIKIDVEGGEYDVLEGAKKTIARCKPVILFEFGKAGAEAYGITVADMYNLLHNFSYKINLLSHFLKNRSSLSFQQFELHYQKGREYFFIAYP